MKSLVGIVGLAAAFAAVAIAVAGAAPARPRAQAGSLSASLLKDGEVIVRCRESTPELRDAEVALRALDQRIRGLSVSASPAEAIKELHALLRTECFRLAAVENPRRRPSPDSSLSLREWWGDENSGGGFDWLAVT